MKIGTTADLHFRGGPMLDVIGTEWRALHEEGRRRGLDAIIVAGDLFDDPCLALGRDASAGDVAAAIIEPIVEFGIETIVLPGNHDWRFGRKSALELLRGIPNVRIVDRPEIVALRRGDEVVNVAVLPWIWNSHLRSLPEYQDLPHGEFAAVATEKRRRILSGFAAQWHADRAYKILAGHAEVEGSRNRYIELPAGSTQVFTQHDLRLAQADAVVLGHVHLRQLDYVGSLVQQNFGEQDNPTGWLLIDTATGAREFVENRAPRHYTVTVDAFRTLEYRAGVDRVKVRDVSIPLVSGSGSFGDGVALALPEGVRFEKLLAPRETRLRADGISTDSTTEDLLRAWLPLRHPDQDVEQLLPTLHKMLEHVEIRSKEQCSGAVEAIREVRLRNIGPHADTHLVVPAEDGLMAIIGQNGCLDGDTLIEVPRNCREQRLGTPMRDLVGTQPLVYAYNFSTQRVDVARAARVWKTGTKPVYRVTFKYRGGGPESHSLTGGRGSRLFRGARTSITGTFDHPILMRDGTWRKLGELQPGDQAMPFYRYKRDQYLGIKTLTSDERDHHIVARYKLDGEIPDGWHVHHENHEKWDNRVENLTPEPAEIHLADHARLSPPHYDVHPRGMLGKRHSEETKARIGVNSQAAIAPREMTCNACGELFFAHPRARYCSPECWKQVALRDAREKYHANGGWAALKARKRAKQMNHKVVSIEYVGEQDVYDMEVPGYGNFVANGLIVHNSGKTMLLEALCAAVFGEMPFYPGALYDLTREGFTGEALIEVVFEADGRTYRSRRSLRLSAKTRTQEAHLFQITADGDRALAGPKTADFDAAVRPIVGDKETFFATVFQGQNDVGSIIDVDPSERMQFARKWVGADRYEQAAGWCKLEAATVLGGVAQQDRWLQEQGDVGQRVAEAEGRQRDEEAWGRRIDQQIEDAEGRLQVERDERAGVETRIARCNESARHVETLERGARDLEAEVSAIRFSIGRDQTQLAREPELQVRVDELAGLRIRHGEALRVNEIAAAARSRQAALTSECGRLRQAIDAAVADARAKVELERQRLRQEAASLQYLIGQRTSAQAAEVAKLQAEEARLAGRVKDAERAAVVEVDRQRETLRQAIRDLQRAVDRERGGLEATLQTKRAQLAGLEAKARLLDGAGCRETPLPCRFLSDAAAAPQQITALKADISTVETALAFDDYALDVRGRISHEEQALAALIEPDLHLVAVDVRAELQRVRDGLAAASAPVDVSDLVQQQMAIETQLRGVLEVDGASVATELRAELTARQADAAAVVVPAGADVAGLEREIRLREGAERELGGLAELRRGVEVRVGELEIKTAGLTQRHAEIAAARLEVSQMAVCFQERDQVDQRIAGITADVQRLRREASQAAERVGAARAEVEAVRALLARVEAATAELRPRREEAARLSLLAEAFGPTGVPQLLIDMAIPALNDILADLVSDMDEPVQIEFTTQRQLKGGGSREGLWINVTDVGGTRDIRRHSCGEQGFLRKVVRQAMGLFSAQRRGRHHRIYCVDEPTLGLDENNVPRLLGIIYRLASRFRQVWIVSHDSVLLQGIPIHFRLDKVNGATRLHGGAPAAERETVTV